MLTHKLGILRTLVLLALVFFSASAWAKDSDHVTLNFKDADIRALIEFVSSFSGKNFLVDNRVKGRVTIVSPSPISKEEAYDVFLSVLEVNGFAAVPSGSIVKIIPRAESKQKSLPVRENIQVENDAMITQVMRLKYADAQQLVALIQPLISPNSHLVAYPRGNMLLLTDSASNIARIQRVLKFLDRKDAVGVQLFRLQHASADKLATTITNLYASATRAAGGSMNAVKAMAHQPGNILLVVAAPQILNEVGGVIKRLDVPPESDSGRLKVRYLKFAHAADVAGVINELIGGQSGAAKVGQRKRLFTGDIKVVADPSTNALLITADPSDISALNRIIDKLDVKRRQVLIEAMIVEVSANVAQQFGIEWFSGKTINNGNNSVVGGQNFGTIGPVGQAVADANNSNIVSSVAGVLPTGLTVGFAQGSLADGTISLGAIARALESKGDTNVLSTPNLLTMDNEEAEIVVGQNVPFITGQSSTQGGVANPFQTIERKDVGLTLKVKPQISEGDAVRLELYQEISSIDTAATGQGSDLITNKRSIKTVVLANNGQMIVLGGLMRNDNTSGVQRVPCIGAVPVIGEPFKFTDNSHRKTNLMVFLRPHIIKSNSDIENLTNEKYGMIQKLYETPVEGGTIVFPRQERKMPDDLRPDLSKAKNNPGDATNESTLKDGGQGQ